MVGAVESLMSSADSIWVLRSAVSVVAVRYNLSGRDQIVFILIRNIDVRSNG
jgi:hypothetical protein